MTQNLKSLLLEQKPLAADNLSKEDPKEFKDLTLKVTEAKDFEQLVIEAHRKVQPK